MRTPKEKSMTYKKLADSEVEDSSLSDIAKNAQNSAFRGSLPVNKSDPFQKELDRLADEVRKDINKYAYIVGNYVF